MDKHLELGSWPRLLFGFTSFRTIDNQRYWRNVRKCISGDPYYNISVNGNNEYLDGELFAATKILSGVEFRANNIESLDNLEKNSVDFYASVRSLYTQDRQNKIKNIQRGNIEVIYNEDGDWEEIDTK